MQVQNWTMHIKTKNKTFYKNDKKASNRLIFEIQWVVTAVPVTTAPAPCGAVYEKIHSWVQTISC